MLDKDSVRQFYDRMWSETGPELNRHERDRFAAILSLVAGLRRPNSKVLDAGCGRGKLSERLARLGDLTGIDWSEAGVRAARQRVPEGRFETFDLVRDDPARFAGGFGLVVCTEVLEHVGRENRARLIERLSRCLCAGGWLVLTTPNRLRAEALADVIHRHQPEEDLLRAEETLALVEGGGLKIDHVGSATVCEGLWERSSLFRRARSTLRRDVLGRDVLDRLLARTQRGLYLVVSARKPG